MSSDATLTEHATDPVQTGPGARFRNRNNLRHGLSSGALPDGCGYIQSLTNQLRRALEDAIVEKSGEVSLTQAGIVQTIIRWERHSLLAQRWLRLKQGELSNDQLLNFSREVAKASSERDKAMKALDLDRSEQQTILDALYCDQPDH